MTEFDTVKGAFLLVAVVICTMMTVVLVAIFSCASLLFMGTGAPACEQLQPFIQEIIQMSFTAAIAFAGGRMSAPVAQSPKLPEKDKVI